MSSPVAPHPSLGSNGSHPPPVGAPALPAHPSAQEEFDIAVRRNAGVGLRVLAAVAILAALAMSTAALVQSNGTHGAMMNPGVAAAPISAPTAPIAVPTAPIALSVAGSNKLGPDGRMHDSFSRTDFAVKVGQPQLVRIDNEDGSPHSITSTAAGVSITVLPGVHTYTILATRAGRFEWVCVIPCDSGANGWAMTHPGYMAGYITAG
ncbi:MAG: cupredoxin domain-containing protein [Solirubrobacteraceae bacterium]